MWSFHYFHLDSTWFEQDSGEFDLEFCKMHKEDDDDDEDTVSLPSSDEEDTPLTNYANLFPSNYHQEKQDFNSNQQAQSLDGDLQTFSSVVPNTTEIAQQNVCYSFVRNAFKKFSSVNSTDEDSYSMSQLDSGVDSAVPPSPIIGQEQSFNFLYCSSLNLVSVYIYKAI